MRKIGIYNEGDLHIREGGIVNIGMVKHGDVESSTNDAPKSPTAAMENENVNLAQVIREPPVTEDSVRE